MANHPSAEKRNRQTTKRTARNRHHRTNMRTRVKRVLAAIELKDKKSVSGLLKLATQAIDRAAQKGILSPRTASRHISRLTQAVNRLGATTTAPAEKKPRKAKATKTKAKKTVKRASKK